MHKTNTGKLVKEVLGKQCSVFEWQRKQPSAQLLQYIASQSVALLYPHQNSNSLGEQEASFDAYILIDATWQEAQKIKSSPKLFRTVIAIAFLIISITSISLNSSDNGKYSDILNITS